MDKPWKVITAFIGVFVAGAIFGGFFALGIGWQVVERRAQPAAATPVMPPVATTTQPAPKKGPNQGATLPVPQALQSTLLKRKLLDRLDLTPAQRERIMPFIQRATEDFRRQQANYFREDFFILQRLQQDIARELTPDQRAKLVELEHKQAEIVRRRREAEMQAMKKAMNGSAAPAAAETPSGTPSTAAPGPAVPAASDSQTTSSATSTTSSAEKKE